MTFLSWFGREAQQNLFLNMVDTVQWNEGCAGTWHGRELTIEVRAEGQQPCGPQSSLLWEISFEEPAQQVPCLGGTWVTLGGSAAELKTEEPADVGLSVPSGASLLAGMFLTPPGRKHCRLCGPSRSKGWGRWGWRRKDWTARSLSLRAPQPPATRQGGMIRDWRRPPHLARDCFTTLVLTHLLGRCLCLQGLVRTWNRLWR